MEKTWKPTTAGILSIIGGAVGVIGGVVIAGLGVFIAELLRVTGLPDLSGIALPGLSSILPSLLGSIVAVVAAVPIVLGIVAIIGGVYALERRRWGLALAGSICSLFCLWLFGILATIFVAMGKGEFKRKNG